MAAHAHHALVAAAALWLVGDFAHAQAPAAPPSSAAQRAEWAQTAIRKNPGHFQPYNDLAAALIQRGRESGGLAAYDEADAALQQSLRLSPDNFDAGKLAVQILVGRGRFGEAVEMARSLNARLPDDVAVYGLLADASIEVGDYDEALKAAQFMFDLRPPTARGFVIAARLREVFGDLDGAAEFLESAYRSTPAAEHMARAMVLAERIRLAARTRQFDRADALARDAAALAPDQPDVLAAIAGARTAMNHHAAAAEIWRRLDNVMPHPRYRYELARSLERTGRLAEAAQAYGTFEREAARIADAADNANRELADYYAGRGRRPAEAVRIARLELARRHDVRTLAVAAAALHASGNHAEARTQIRKALATGVRDAEFFCTAGTIERSLKHPREASRYFRQSAQLNPTIRCRAR